MIRAHPNYTPFYTTHPHVSNTFARIIRETWRRIAGATSLFIQDIFQRNFVCCRPLFFQGCCGWEGMEGGMQQKKITKDLPVVNNWETFYTPFADREKGAPGVLEEHELARDYELLLVMVRRFGIIHRWCSCAMEEQNVVNHFIL
ncbi:hypothetical protein CEXT_438101 [Caerostris extrusa]|uniref:Uncharacterized protein n=1 Tax=Caerostris extrusa TaxID=172846 RepID=A0AAV4MEB2_CAEEX|nr:hypothetical protein CEXT_438101 [Caerostris extrusa]